MSGSLNEVTIIGNLGKDPEVKRMQDGRPIVNMSVACSESWRDKATGERREKTEWIRVVIFHEPLAKIAEQYLRKGSKVWIRGKLQTRKWQDQQGQDRFSTEVVLQGFNSGIILLSPMKNGGDASAADDGDGQSSSPAPKSRPSTTTRDDDEIPF